MSKQNGHQINSTLLSYWGKVCREANADGRVCFCQLTRDGLEVTLIGPQGDRAQILMPWNEVANSGVPPGVIHEILSALRKNLRTSSLIF